MLVGFKSRINKLVRDNKGSAIVIVIVALAMVGILAMTIMWMSMTNYFMKATDKGNKQGFYTAETVLEQIKAGLEEDASWAASRAYALVLTKDYSASSTADRDYEFKKAYQDYFIEKVGEYIDPYHPEDGKKYSLSHLLSFVDDAASIQITRPSSGRIRYLTSREKDDVTGATEGECKIIHSYSSNLIKLQDLYLEYTDEDANGNEFVSIINTDIIIMVPDIAFTQTSVLPDVFEYALIADKKLTNGLGTGSTINGNIYAGDEGIELHSVLNIEYPKQESGRLISKGGVKIGPEAEDPLAPALSEADTKLNIGLVNDVHSEFWAEDIALDKGKGLYTKNTDTYVADDITLSGRKTTVKMSGGGKYYGYGSSDSNPDESSAIIVNGLGSTVDLKELDKVMLLGRTFVSIPNYVPKPGSLTEKIYSPDIYAMGESLAVKGEQVAFLVPDECLMYVDLAVSSNSVPMPNPFIASEYKKDRDGDGIKDHDIIVNKSNLPASYRNEITFNDPPEVYPFGSNLGYVYMKMTSETANKYYKDYYKENLDKLNNYFLVYAGVGKIELPAGSNVNSEGDFLTKVISDNSIDSDKIVKNKDSQLYEAIPETDKADITADLSQKKKNLCAKLIKDGVTASELGNTLFNNLVLEDEILKLVTNNTSPYEFKETVGGVEYKAVFSKNDSGTPYEYSSDDKTRVLVVIGDVDIKADFTGLLIASGTVKIEGSHTITSIVNGSDADIQALRGVLTKKQSVQISPTFGDNEDRSALQYFRNGSSYNLDGIQSGGAPTVSKNNIEFTELVKFNNWVKK